jgi:hypothetical protein
MFVGSVDLGNGTALELIIVPLKGFPLRGQWENNTDLLLLCVMQSGKFCTFRPSDDANRYVDKLGLSIADARLLAQWLQNNPAIMG